MKEVFLVILGFVSLVLCCTVVASGPPEEVIVAGFGRGTVTSGLGLLSLLAWGLFLFSK